MPLPARLPHVLLRGALAALMLVAAAGPAPAQDGIGPPPPGEVPGPERVEVWLLTGPRVAGDLVREDDRQIVIEVGGIEVTVEKGRIARIDRLPSIEAQYRANRRLIGDHDVGQLLRLVEWLVENDRLLLARDELDAILERAPGHRGAAQARVQVQAKIELKRRKADPDAVRRDPPENTFPLLTDDQVNLLKVYEVDLADPPRLLVERETVQRLITAFADDPKIPQTPEGRETLLSRSAPEILALMFELQARDFYGEVRVLDMPRAFRLFRQDVHGWLLNRCATPRCHGGTDAGRLQLANPPFRANRDEVVLSNFLILERFRTSDGRPLIDYDQPERSPLIHLGVMRENSLYPHPPVPGPGGRGDLWRQQFRSENDPGAVFTQAWIRSMYLPRPDYPIQYDPPQGEPPPREREVGKPR